MTADEGRCLFPGFLHYVDHWVRTTPAAPALVFQQTAYSYQDLAAMTRVIAGALRGYGIGSGTIVAISTDRSELLLPLLLAVWSLRAVYVPVDPGYPLQRRAYILDHAEAEFLIVDVPAVGLDYAGTQITLDALRSYSAPDIPRPLAAADYADSDLAYIIYTSGSTGNPKGVAISQRNLHNFLLGMRDQPGFTNDDRLLAVTTISFDIHVLELYLPLLVGAQLILATREQAMSGQWLRQLIDACSVTVLQATPATWRMVLSGDWRPQTPLRILIGGEALPRDLRPLLHAAASEVWNMYGPTETTVWSTCHRVGADDSLIFIGLPIRDTQTLIVDEQLRPVPAGSAGELLIGGAGLAQGYHRNPDMTAERFIAIPDSGGGKWYRTGDRVVAHDDGLLQYIDRLDNQIKIRGYRIEPGDIEAALEKHPGVTQSVVVASTFGEGDVRLIAWYLGQSVASSELLNWCRQHLPDHMVPQHFLPLRAMPMTANLKIDRKKLAADAPQKVESAPAEPSSAGCRDDLDTSLVTVWENTLGVRGIGIDDNFFELGGHSLLALQITNDMRIATGVSFPETILFESPTIRGARDLMGEQAERAAIVVKLNAATSGIPVFCLCGVKIYQELANHFADRRPVYSVFARKEIDILDARKKRHKVQFDFDSLVQSYVDAILRQGDIPRLSLVGLSFGGLVALEATRRFREMGVEVHDVVLLDTYLPDSTYLSPAQAAGDIGRHWQRVGLEALGRDVGRRLWAKLSSRQHRALRYFNLQEAEGQREKAFDEAAAHFDAAHRHYGFDALLIKARLTDFGFGRRARPDYGLRRIIKGRLTIRTVTARHQTMLSGEAALQVYQYMEAYHATNR